MSSWLIQGLVEYDKCLELKFRKEKKEIMISLMSSYQFHYAILITKLLWKLSIVHWKEYCLHYDMRLT